MKIETGKLFIITGMLSLGAGILMGSTAALQFVFPGFFDLLPFVKSRPLHVSLVVSWIFLGAIGGIYHYLPKFLGLQLHSKKLALLHFWLFILTGLLILGSYTLGKFGGREYWEFPPVFSIPIIFSWIVFVYNFFRTVIKVKEPWPVYLWMWGTGMVFFLYTFMEANLWVFNWFGTSVVQEITIQWKANGALVGSWNMLVYGTALFIMEQISGNRNAGQPKLTFFFYFLGLSNLMFGWAHHTYFVPAAQWIRHIAYMISMTELILLAKITWSWKQSLSLAKIHSNKPAYLFLMASECWIFLNLILAILISVPSINLFTHGTHITVAHSMGSTIGINTMILLASVFFMISSDKPDFKFSLIEKSGFYLSNVALLLFWICLIMAGYTKGKLVVENQLPFQEIMKEVIPYLIAFTIAGIILFAGLLPVIISGIKNLIPYSETKKK